MVQENPVIPTQEWLAANIWPFLLLLVAIVGLALFGGYLIAAIRNGPFKAVAMVWDTIVSAFQDVTNFSVRRVFAIARLAFQEALRRRVLIAFAVFVLFLLLGGWFLDRGATNPAVLYLTFVLTTTNFLILVLAIVLSAFSLPQDMKNRTIYTIVTKPVRPWEIVLGRIIGFAALATLFILIMGVCSFVFVTRGLAHQHEIDSQQAAAVTEDVEGLTSLSVGHRHTISVDESGELLIEAGTGHQHRLTTQDDIVTGPSYGALQARVPVHGKLRFLDRSGEPAESGVSVGSEWKYRSYIEGGTLATAIWTFEGISEERFPDGLPLEMAIRVFRTYQGEIERGIMGSFVVANPNPNKPLKRSMPVNFMAQEFVPEKRLIGGASGEKLTAMDSDSNVRDIDLFEDLVEDGKVEIRIQCSEGAQYFGAAQADIYLRAADRPFLWNFTKGYVGIWVQMLVVTSLGVMFSTFLTGAVAMLATVCSIVLGYFASFIAGVAAGTIEGGGPAESTYRLFRQWNLSTEMEAGIVTTIIKSLDWVLMLIIWSVSQVLPDFREFTTSHFVAYGFNIPGDLISQHVLIAMLYFLLISSAGYFFLKTREIAA